MFVFLCLALWKERCESFAYAERLDQAALFGYAEENTSERRGSEQNRVGTARFRRDRASEPDEIRFGCL